MDQQIIARFNDFILHEAMRRYNIAMDGIKPLDSFESFIFEFERDGAGYILRIEQDLPFIDFDFESLT
jgi:hypothetical protein